MRRWLVFAGISLPAAIVAACTSFQGGNDATSSPDAGPEAGQTATPEAASPEAAPVEAGPKCPFECGSAPSIVCDDFNRETPIGPTFAKTTDTPAADAGWAIGQEMPCGGYLSFDRPINQGSEELMLIHTTSAPLDSLTAEMDLWVEADFKGYGGQAIIFAVGQPDRILTQKYSGLQMDQYGMSLSIHEDVDVTERFQVPTSQWVHILWRVDYAADKGRVRLELNHSSTIDKVRPTLASGAGPFQGYSAQVGLRSISGTPHIVLKIDNLRLTRNAP